MIRISGYRNSQHKILKIYVAIQCRLKISEIRYDVFCKNDIHFKIFDYTNLNSNGKRIINITQIARTDKIRAI